MSQVRRCPKKREAILSSDQMERRLLEAARKGNIHELHELISSNELILEEMDLEESSHTPLHVACVAGHLDFVRELLKRMPKLAEKVNASGLSPLHIAATQGNVEIARELLTVGPHLWSVKGRERRIPLHYAAIKGELDVMKLLLFSSPESIEKTTALEETALHLAVKNNRFDAVVVLVDHLKQQRKEQVINRKDHKGNTALHLAADGKNFEVVNFLLYGRTVKSEVVEVNALNERGLTPLDVSTLSRREAGDREIKELLVQAGARHGRGSRPISAADDNDIEGGNSHQSAGEEAFKDAPPSLRRSRSKDSKAKNESFADIRNALLVVAVLIASATYQSVLQPPKIIEVLQPPKITENQTKLNDQNSTKSLTEHYGGGLVYGLFLGGNTLGFVVSVQMIICLTRDDISLGTKLPLKLPLRLSLMAMVLTYFCFTLSLLFSTIGKKSPPRKFLHLLPLMISFLLLMTQRWLAIAINIFLEWLIEFPFLGNMYDLEDKDSENKDRTHAC
ncbi:hypothetical protein BT93_E1227 [Corymbia citriodora subsp. variegata]|nr:hypothetical protein BT93_E1227 [Corymbia citriodora subsp. variegata]